MTIEHNAPHMPLPNLSVEQARVFACLIEKNLATPNNYPLTINSLLLACNQKTNRHPVMSLTEGGVGKVVNELVELNLAKIDYGERAKKVTHLAMREFNISKEEAAVMCMLILREPLTLNDIKARTEKMIGFESVDAVQKTVDQLINRTYPFVVIIPKSTGRREDRYTHLLCGEIDIESLQEDSAQNSSLASNKNQLMDKIDALESRVIKLEEQLNNLI